MNFALLQEYFGVSFDREYAEKLVVEAFEEDTGLKWDLELPRMMKRRRMRTRLGGRHERQRQRMLRGSWERMGIRRIGRIELSILTRAEFMWM